MAAGSAAAAAQDLRARAAAATAAGTTSAPAQPPARRLDRDLLLPVSGLRARPGSTSVRLAWSDPVAAHPVTTVVVRKAGTAAAASPSDGTLVTRTTATSWTDATVSPTTTYTFTAFAQTSQETAAPTSTTVTTGAAPDTAPPAPVQSLTTNASSTSVALGWRLPSGVPATGVVVRRQQGSTPPSSPTAGSLVADVPAPVLAVTDTGLAPGTTYSYALFAHGQAPGYAAVVTASATTRTTRTGTCTTTWTGAGGSDWSTATSWSTGAVPSAGDWVCIPAGAANEPVKAETATVRGLTLDGSIDTSTSGAPHLTLTDPSLASTIGGSAGLLGSTLSVASELLVPGTIVGRTDSVVSGRVTVQPGGSVRGGLALADGGALENDGLLALTDYVNGRGGVTVGSAGTVSLTGSSGFEGGGAGQFNTCDTGDAATLTLAASGRVTGSGRLGSFVDQYGGGACAEVLDETSWTVTGDAVGYPTGNFHVLAGASFGGGLFDLSGDVHVDVPRLVVATPLVINGVVEGGDLVSTQSLELNGTWNGPGTLDVAPGSSASVGAQEPAPGHDEQVGGGTFVNEGNTEVGVAPRSRPLRVALGAELDNAGTLLVEPGGQVTGDCGATAATPPALLVSTGTVTVAGRPNAGTTFGLGTVGGEPACLRSVLGGELALGDAALTMGGDVDLVPGFVVDNAGAGASLTWLNTIRVDLGTLDVPVALAVGGRVGGPVEDLTAQTSLDLEGTWTGPGRLAVPVGATFAVTTPASWGEVDGGVLDLEGSGTIDPGSGLRIGGTAAVVVGGSLALGGSASITGTYSQTCATAGLFAVIGSLTTAAAPQGSQPTELGGDGCLDVAVEGTLAISGQLDLDGTSLLDDGSSITGDASSDLELLGLTALDVGSLTGVAHVLAAGTTLVEADLLLPATDVSGTLGLAPAVTAVAAGLHVGSSVLVLEASAPGGWGQLVTSGGVDLSAVDLDLVADGFTPSCGAAVTAVEAGSVTAGFEAADGEPLPSGGSWQPTATASTAGAVLTC